MAELKVKKARTIEVSPLLSVDSPMVIWHIDELEEGKIAGPGIDVSGGGESPVPQPDQFMVVCNAFPHPPDLLGTLPNGVWMTGLIDNKDLAFGHAQTHEDGGAQVFLSVGAILVGPISQF